MSTGVIKLQKIIGKNTFNDLYELISKVEPEEIIISEGFEKINLFNSKFNQFKKKITTVPSGFFIPENNKEKIKTFFKRKIIYRLSW